MKIKYYKVVFLLFLCISCQDFKRADKEINKEGLIDILLAGNKYDMEIETTRADTSVGLLLVGTEHGIFEEVDYQAS